MSTDPGGEHQNKDADLFDYDAELRRYHQRLRTVIDVSPGERVLDIGCGTGQTTREAARAAVAGSAVGVDISARMLARARRLSAEEGLHNVTFAQADAQVHPFPARHFTLGISRFGTMFFTDPVAAFTNIGRALSPGARLVQIVWQGRDRQEWDIVLRHALADAPAQPDPATPDPFSLADPATIKAVLTAAGFNKVSITDVREPIYYGPDADAACNAALSLQMTKELLAKLDAIQAQRALQRLHASLTARDTGEGVWFDSRAWIITAHHH